MGRASSRAAGLFVALLALGGLARPASAVRPSEDLISLLETAPAVVVGRVASVSPLAHGGWLAHVEVERTLGDVAEGPRETHVVWEEPAPSLPARFAAGQRVLLGLGPLPTASIWKTRLPDEARRAATVAVAGGGGAFAHRPSLFDLDTLEHYLALSASARAGDAGAVRLAELVQGGSPDVARGAWSRFAQGASGDARPLPPLAARSLAAALTRDDAGDLPERIVVWIGQTRPETLLPAIDARLEATAPGDAAPTALLAARAALTGGLDPESVDALAESDDPARRLLAAERVRGDAARVLLPYLVRTDPAAPVRAAALAHWVSLAGEAALPEALGALGDPAAPVRKQAAESLASLGEPAIGPLLAEVDRGTPDAARTAIVALAMMGEPARGELQAIADDHEDEAMRTLARVALGLPIGHLHD